MERLLKAAEDAGIRVLYGSLDGRNGVYYDDLGLIILEQSLSPEMERFTLAHELGHAHHGHRESTLANEMKADEFAAKSLVHEGEYQRAESISDNPRFIAQELGLPVRAIEAYWRLKDVLPMATRVGAG